MSATTKMPDGLQEIYFPAGMSNFDHSIEDGFEEALRAGGVFGRHAGWNFNGSVWFDAESGLFMEQVLVYGTPCAVFSASSLLELMSDVNDEYGWD